MTKGEIAELIDLGIKAGEQLRVYAETVTAQMNESYEELCRWDAEFAGEDAEFSFTGWIDRRGW